MINTLDEQYELIIANSLRELDFGQLMGVYEESNSKSVSGILAAEQDFFCYLRQVFFKGEGCFYAILSRKDRYVSALRLEPYQDGLLLSGLETAPSERGKGYAGRLLKAVMMFLRCKEPCCIYSHIRRNNASSVKVHKSCGFCKCLDHAVMIDGSFLSDHDTYFAVIE